LSIGVFTIQEYRSRPGYSSNINTLFRHRRIDHWRYPEPRNYTLIQDKDRTRTGQGQDKDRTRTGQGKYMDRTRTGQGQDKDRTRTGQGQDKENIYFTFCKIII